MKVLVTGATGFIGRHLVPSLLERGHTVTAVGRDVARARARNFPWFDQVRFIAFDIHGQDLGAADRFEAQEAVIHLAWSGLPNYQALFHFERNLPADYRFLKTLVERGISQLLVAGSCLEYGLENGSLSEELPTQPANPYALAKDTLRKFLETLQTREAFTLQWARLFYMHGPGQNANSLLAQLDRAIESGEVNFNMSGGEQLRDYLPVEKVARRLVVLLEHPECEGAVNVCSGKPVSVRRLVEQYLAERGAVMHLNLGYYPYPDHEPMAFWGNPHKFNRLCRND